MPFEMAVAAISKDDKLKCSCQSNNAFLSSNLVEFILPELIVSKISSADSFPAQESFKKASAFVFFGWHFPDCHRPQRLKIADEV